MRLTHKYYSGKLDFGANAIKDRFKVERTNFFISATGGVTVVILYFAKVQWTNAVLLADELFP